MRNIEINVFSIFPEFEKYKALNNKSHISNIIFAMFFCEKCRYLFNVTNDVRGKQVGGKIDTRATKIFDKIDKGEQLVEKDLEKIKGLDIKNSTRFEEMSKKDQKRVITILKAVDKSFFDEEPESETEQRVAVKEAFFICKKCKNYKPIRPCTTVFSKNYSDSVSNEVDENEYEYAIYDPSLPRTRVYICKNPKCPSHKDESKREAALTKKLEHLVYVCCACKAFWLNSY